MLLMIKVFVGGGGWGMWLVIDLLMLFEYLFFVVLEVENVFGSGELILEKVFIKFCYIEI